MNELNKISNEDFLNELSKKLNEGEIRIEGNKLATKIEKRQNGYYNYRIELNIDIGKLVNEVISELKENYDLARREKEWQEEQYKKQLEKLKTGNQSS